MGKKQTHLNKKIMKNMTRILSMLLAVILLSTSVDVSVLAAEVSEEVVENNSLEEQEEETNSIAEDESEDEAAEENKATDTEEDSTEAEDENAVTDEEATGTEDGVVESDNETASTEDEAVEFEEEMSVDEESETDSEQLGAAAKRAVLSVTPNIHSDTVYGDDFNRQTIVFKNEGTEPIDGIEFKSFVSDKGTDMNGNEIEPRYGIMFNYPKGYQGFELYDLRMHKHEVLRIEPGESVEAELFIYGEQCTTTLQAPFVAGTNLTTTVTFGGTNFDDCSTTITLNVYAPPSPQLQIGEYKYIKKSEYFGMYEFDHEISRIDLGTIETGTEDFTTLQEGIRRAYGIKNISKEINPYTGKIEPITYYWEIIGKDAEVFNIYTGGPWTTHNTLEADFYSEFGIKVNCSYLQPGSYSAMLHLYRTVPANTTYNGTNEGRDMYIPITMKIDGGNDYYYSTVGVTGLKAEGGDGYIKLTWDPIGGVDQRYLVYYKGDWMDGFSAYPQEVEGTNFYYDKSVENGETVSYKVCADLTYGDDSKKNGIRGISDSVTATASADGKKLLQDPYLYWPDDDYEDKYGNKAVHLEWNLKDSYDNGNGQNRYVEYEGKKYFWTKNSAVDYFYIVKDGKKLTDDKGELVKIKQSDYVVQYRWDTIDIEGLGPLGFSYAYYTWSIDIPALENDEYAHSFYVVPVAPDGTEGIPSSVVQYNNNLPGGGQRPLPEKPADENSYTVTFNGNGGFAKAPIKTVKTGEAYGALSDAWRSGYKLIGWFTKADGGEQIFPETIFNLTKDQTLYAHWQSTTHKVTLNAMGGTVTPAKVDVEDGETYNLPTPVYKGHKFVGWYTEIEGGTKITSDTIVDLTGDQTLYAHWLVCYNVILDPGTDGFTWPNVIEVVYSLPYGKLPAAERDGYTFMGWYLEKEGEEPKKIEADTIVEETKAHTLVAYWKGASYIVTFDGNGVEITEPAREVSIGMPYGTLPELKRAGYTFEGWFTAAEGGTKITSATKVSITSNHTLYAHWILTPYKLVFDAQGGIVEPVEKTVYFDGTSYGELPVPVFAGCEFLGWFTQPEGGTQVTAETILPEEKDQTIYAHWSYKYTTKAPVSDTPEGEVLKGTRVNLGSETEDAQIYFTTDPAIGMGVTKENGTLWDDAFVVEEDVIIYAIAVKNGFMNSEVKSFAYTVKDESADWGDIRVEDRAGIDDPEQVPDQMWAAGIEDADYTGSAITFPDMHVYWHKTALNEGKDYTVRYLKNQNAGTAEIALTGKGNYSGRFTLYFNIRARELGIWNAEKNAADNSERLIIPDVYAAKTTRVQKKTTYVAYNLAKAGEADRYVVLKAGKDFKYEYAADKNYKDSGTYQINIVGIGNYCGKGSFNEYIVDSVNTMDSLRVDRIPNQETLPGNAPVKPEITARDAKGQVIDAENYTVSYYNNTKAGTATVCIEGKGAYSGTKVVTFLIKARSIKKAKVTALPAMEYTGESLQQTGYVLTYKADSRSPEEELKEGTDYIVKMSNNVNAGRKAAVTFAGIGQYEGELTKNFIINPYKLTDEHVVMPADMSAYAYRKNGTTPDVNVIVNGKTLTKDKDYTVRYANNRNVNDGSGKLVPTVVITGKGNYSGTVTRLFTITPGTLSDVKLEATDITYAARAGLCKPRLTATDVNGAKLAAGIDYDRNQIDCTYLYDVAVENNGVKSVVRNSGEKVDAKDIIPAGTAIRVTIYGVGNYAGTQQSTVFRYVKANLSQARIKIADKAYTGSAILLSKDDITLTYKNAPLSKADYEIIGYSKNVDSGTANVTLKGVGNYGGTRVATFRINKKAFTYTISFDANDAYMKETKPFAPVSTGIMRDLAAQNKTILTQNAFKRNGYMMTGWNTKPDGSGVSYDNREAFRLKSNPFAVLFFGKSITLYAQWSPQTYKLKYPNATNLTGGVVNNNATTYDIENPVTFIEAYKEGYVLEGWYLDPKCTKKITGTAVGDYGDKSIYAKWVKKP